MSDNSTNPYAPVGESAADILNDSVNLIASTTICGAAYGAMALLYFICAYFLLLQIKREKHRHSIFLLAYMSLMFVFGTIYVASNARTIQLAYVNDRNYPGGPAVYDMVIFDEAITIVGLVAFFAANWMADALLLWRLSIIYRGSPYLIPVMIFPSLLFVTSLAMSLVTIVQSCSPNQSFWSSTAVKFALAYYSLTVSLTIIATALMIVRLLLFRRKFMRLLGNQHASQYMGIAAMLIESSALYAVWSIVFLGLYIVNHPVQYVFLASLAEVQIIAPLLIIFRVSQGKAWNQSTAATLTTFWTKSSSGDRGTVGDSSTSLRTNPDFRFGSSSETEKGIRMYPPSQFSRDRRLTDSDEGDVADVYAERS